MAVITSKDDICESKCEYWDIWPKCVPDEEENYSITEYGVMLYCANFSAKGKDISQI